MGWVSILALFTSTAALAAAFILWRKLRRIQRQDAVRKSTAPGDGVRAPYDSLELTLEAMLEEMEARGREVLQKLERRERELNRILTECDTLARRLVQGALSSPSPGDDGPARGSDGEPSSLQSRTSSAKAEAVRRLADEGLDVLEIAKRLGLGKGEVKLILDLTDSA